MRRIYLLTMILITVVLSATAQNSTIKGRITTMDGQPAALVNVMLQGLVKGTKTDEEGRFSLQGLTGGVYTLIISHTGLQTIEKQVDVTDNRNVEVNLSLQENAGQLEAVVVEGRKSFNDKPVAIGKLPVDPLDLPQAITVISKAVIEEQQAQRLSDVVRNVNGVYLATTRGAVQESFSARGYGFSSTNLFKNGSRVNTGVMPEMSSLESVEVLKGGAAILYGQVAPGGVINMITRQPKFNFGGEVSVRAGSHDLYKPAFDVYGPLSSKVAFRVNGSFESAGSFRDNVWSKRYYVNPSFLIKLGNRTDLLVQGDYLKTNFTPDFGIGSIGTTKIPDVPVSRYMGAVWSYNKAEQSAATATVKHQLNDAWKLTFTASYQQYYRDYYATERIQAAASGDWTRPLGRIDSKEKYYIAQADLTGQFKTRFAEHRLLAGVDADHYLTNSYTFSFPAVTGLAAGSYDVINVLEPAKYTQRTDIPAATRVRELNAPINRFGAYVQDLIKLSAKFNLLAGVRWSFVQNRTDTTLLSNGAHTQSITKIDKAFSPRFGLVYKPTAKTAVFASYSNSFSVNTGTDIYGSPVAPSIINQYEAGVKNDFFNGMLSANLTFYKIKNNNLAQTAIVDRDGKPNSNTSLKELTGQTISNGVEVDLAGHPLKGLTLLAGYSYNDMRYTKTSDSLGSYIRGERLVNTPAHTANGSIFYTFSSAGLKGLKLGASVFYIGNRLGGYNNTVTQKTPYTVTDRLIPVEGFTTVDLTAGYTFKKVSLLAKVSNLTNTRNYYVHENYSINPIPPTQFVTTVAYKF
jgi:iron complex outermembrane receptor protein